MRSSNRNSYKMVDVHDVRDINQTVFLHLIRERQPISRADISKFTGLRAGTVSAIVNRLIKNDLVYEGVQGPSSGGRPPKYLLIRADSVHAIAIDIGVNDTAYAISDFNGQILERRVVPTEGSGEEFLENLSYEIKNVIKEKYPEAKFGGVGVAAPGLIDRDNGILKVSPNLEWTDVPVREILEKRLDLKVFVENDANAAALSELWFGPKEDSDVRTLLCILVVEGLGTGLIINGELHVGSRLGLGGFGHMSIDPSGELCSCGRRGCWETFASERATVDRFHRVTAKQDDPSIDISALIKLANEGDETALETLKITGEYLGEGIANLIHGIYPETVVIGGNIVKAWSLIAPQIHQRVKSKYLLSPDQISIRPASVDRPSLYGAIPIGLQNYFKSPIRPALVIMDGDDR